jgi:hypothetical protein
MRCLCCADHILSLLLRVSLKRSKLQVVFNNISNLRQLFKKEVYN